MNTATIMPADLSRIKGETTLAASHLPAGWRIEAHEDEALLRQALAALAHYSVDLTTYHYGPPSNPEDGPEQCDCVRCSTIAALRERLSKGA